MIPRVGEPLAKDVRYRIRPGAYAILPRDGKILLTYQRDPEPEFQLPGGGIDAGEQVLPALHREIIEETGWTMHRPRRLTAYRRFTYMPEYELWAEKLCTIYVAHPAVRLSDPLEDGHTAVWMTPQTALSALSNDGDRAALELFLRSRSRKIQT